MSRTPAQVSGNYDFVNDVPIQGPTDPGMRAASCWWAQNVLPVKNPACVDCTGTVPTWAKNPSAWGGGPAVYGGNGTPCGWGKENVRYGGSTLGSVGDPAATLTSDQQAWVVSTIANLDRLIGQSTGTSCTSWVDGSLASMARCFQFWFNANAGGSLRTDGVLDEDSLCALVATTVAHAQDFQTPFPDPTGQRCSGNVPAVAAAPVATVPAAPAAPAATPATQASTPPPDDKKPKEEGLSTGAKIGIGAAAVTVIGGIVYAVTRKS